MSHEKLVVGWIGAPLPDGHFNETVEPWPSHIVGQKTPFNPETDGPSYDKLRASDYVTHFGGNAYNAAVATAADLRIDEVHMLWGMGKSEDARAIEADMQKRNIVSHASFDVNHQNGGSFVKAMGGDRAIVTMPRTPLHETIKPEHVRDFLRIQNLGAVGISSLKSPEMNAIVTRELGKIGQERAGANMRSLFTAHNPGSGEFNADLLESWGMFRHSLIIGNRDEFSELYGPASSRTHAEQGTEYADISVVSDGVNPLQIAYAANVLKGEHRGGVIEVETTKLDRSQVVDTTGAGDRLTGTFTYATYYALQTGELTVQRLVSIAEFAAMEAATVVQYLGGHSDKPYPS